MKETMKVKIFKYDPLLSQEPHYATYRVPRQDRNKVLDVLRYVYSNLDSSLSFNWECRFEVCGQCAVMVNGIPKLACHELATDGMVIEPLSNFPVVKDLVVDKSVYKLNLERIASRLVRREPPASEPEPMDQNIIRSQIDDLARCINCFVCIAGCPVVSVDRLRDFSGPAALLRLARFAYDPRDNDARVSKALSEGLYQCLSCRNCELTCPFNLPIVSSIRKMRYDAARASLGPPRPNEQTNLAIENTGNPFKATDISNTKPTADLPTKGEFAYFAGCYANFKYTDTGRATVKLLQAGGLTIARIPGEICCGLPALFSGKRSLAQKLARRNVEAIRGTGARKVLSACCGCSTMLREEYPELLGNTGFESVHVAELLSDLVSDGKIAFNNEMPLSVTYHDPCHLKHLGLFDPPRMLISKVPGVKLVEMSMNRQFAFCCGGGAIVSVNSPYLSRRISGARVEQAEKTGARTIVTACPSCRFQLSLHARQREMEVLDIPDFLLKFLEPEHLRNP